MIAGTAGYCFGNLNLPGEEWKEEPEGREGENDL